MAILVTGGAGYIGSHAARALRRDGYEVILYDNLCNGDRSLASGFELVVADIADRPQLEKILPRVDAIMHFAAHAYVGESVQNPRKYFGNNVEASLVLLNAAIDYGVKNLVFSSSCAVYGPPSAIPIREDTPRQPINPYGYTKVCFENILQAYGVAYGLHYAILRYFNAAGADDSGEIGELHDPETHLIPLALAAAAGADELHVLGCDYPTPDGSCIRDYIHVNDLADAHVLALKYLASGGDSFAANLGSGHGHSVLQIIDTVEQVTGKTVRWQKVARRPGDPPILIADPSRAQRLLGWTARRGLPEIISSAWNWFRRFPPQLI